jgi:hypothetical protein
MPDNRVTASVIGAPIDAISWDAALAKLSNWASRHESPYVYKGQWARHKN